jgi:phage gpG-like protein
VIDANIQWDDREVQQGLKRIREDMPMINRLILQRWAEEVIKTSQEDYLNASEGDTVHLHSRSGKLSSSLRWWLVGDKAFVGTNLVYAAIHEFGGTIVPRSAKYLHFRTRDGQWHMVKEVHMPPRPYLAPSIKELFQTNRAKRIAELTLEQELAKRMN